MFGLRTLGKCFSNSTMCFLKKKHAHLESLLKKAKPVHLDPSSRILILSDLHMGNGGRLDEFRQNSSRLKFTKHIIMVS